VETTLADHVNTFGQLMLARYGQRVHKVALNAGFTCPNRDGNLGRGGCTFCNNSSFSPAELEHPSIATQIAAGRQVLRKRTGAERYIAYFQSYSNTYGDLPSLTRSYEEALAEPDVIGIAVGTRPDCVADEVLDLLAGYQASGLEVWLELGLQSARDDTLERVNRGHGFSEYRDAVLRARSRGIQVCTHLIVGLPGETSADCLESLDRVLELGVDGLKIHPLHVVKNTILAEQWRRGAYSPLTLQAYVDTVAALVRRTPAEVTFHRLTGTAAPELLLAPQWCSKKWAVLNAITRALGSAGGSPRTPGQIAFHPGPTSRHKQEIAE